MILPPASKAQQRAVAKYMQQNYDEIKVRVPKGRKDEIKTHVEQRGESVNSFIGRAIDEQIKRDNMSDTNGEEVMMDNLRDIVETARKMGTNNFQNLAQLTNQDEGKKMIVFFSRETKSQTVGNWGREENTDEYIGLDADGWILYVQTCQWGADKFKILKEDTKQLTDEEIVTYLSGSDGFYASFMRRFQLLQENN